MTDLLAAIDRIEAARPRVLVVGDCLDDVGIEVEYVRDTDEGGECRPIYRVIGHTSSPGGAGAVAWMCDRLGAEVIEGFGPRTGEKRRIYLDGRQIGPRIDFECKQTPKYLGSWEGAQALLIADYGKGSCTPEFLTRTIERARMDGMAVLVDPARGKPWSQYRGAHVIKCNEQEYSLGHLPGLSEHLVVTHGKHGMTCDGEHYPGMKHDAVDVTGAGDMVLAVLGVCMAVGIALPDACRLANVAAGLKCRKLGAVPVTLAEIREALSVPA